MKKAVALSLAVVLALSAVGVALVLTNSDGPANINVNALEDDVNANIILGTDVMVNGSSISTDPNSAVYRSSSSFGYSIININEAGTYLLNGTAQETQISVNAGDDDAVTLILNGVNISCSSAPAVLVGNAHDPETPGDSGVTIQLATGTMNRINGSSSDDNGGALSSNVSLLLEGNGTLNIEADNEGIETSMHLTINGGNITISSIEDAINANEDDVSQIIINGGTVYADASRGSDGDGVDSNGKIIINGGTVYGFSKGWNSGLDSDLGTTINGGMVFAIGRLEEVVNSSSEQVHFDFSFSRTLNAGTLVYVLDGSGNPVMAFEALVGFSELVFSSPELTSGMNYSVNVGGNVSGTFDAYGLSTSFSVVNDGTLQADHDDNGT